MHAAPQTKPAVKIPAKSAGRAPYWQDKTPKLVPKSLLTQPPVQKGKVAKKMPRAERESKEIKPKTPIDVLEPTLKKLNHAAKTNKKHDTLDNKATESKKAGVIDPSLANKSMGNSRQVDTMAVQEPKKFDAGVFKTKLQNKLSEALPKSKQDADNIGQKVSNNINADLAEQKQNAGGGIETATKSEPVIPNDAQAPIAIQEEPKGSRVNFGKDTVVMPPPKPASETNMDAQADSLDAQLSENKISETTLQNSNEPSFTGAVSEKNKAQSELRSFTKNYKKEENPTLASGQKDSQASINNTMGEMLGVRGGAFGKNSKKQNAKKEEEQAIRIKVAKDLNDIYTTTKKNVEIIFTALDAYVKIYFDTVIGLYVAVFEKDVQAMYDANPGWFGSNILGEDSLSDKEIYERATKKFQENMAAPIENVALMVEQKLNEAVVEIKKGKTKNDEYKASQSGEVQKIADDIFMSVGNKYDELEQQVESKQDEIADAISEQFKAAAATLDKKFEELKEANKSWLDKAFDAVVGVIKAILEIKDALVNLLSAVAEAIDAIISDPIGFLSNLLDGVAQGLNNFLSNFLTKHLPGGLLKWLTGTLGGVGITIPEDIFSLKGIFSLVMQVLGLSWDYIRSKGVKLLGEPVMKALETGFEMFVIFREKGLEGVWEYLKEKFNDLKEKVIDEIQNMVFEKVVEAGIKWLIGLSNPVGAFIKAALAIIDMAKFFFQKAKDMIALVSAITQSILNIARGNIAFVAVAVENALASIIPLAIGFLASLLGIGDLADKVKAIITKIRLRIDQAIDALIDKAKAFGKSILNKIQGKDKTPVQKNDDIAKGNLKDSEVGEVEKFTAAGESHKLWIDTSGGTPKIMVASTVSALESKLSAWETKADEKQKTWIHKARGQEKIIERDAKKAQTAKDKFEKENNEANKKAFEDADKTVENGEKSLMETMKTLFEMFGEKNDNPLLQFIGKKVLNDEGAFISGFEELLRIDYHLSPNDITKEFMIRRNPGKADNLTSIYIDKEDILRAGKETVTKPKHKHFVPTNLKILLEGGIYFLTYNTKYADGAAGPSFKIDISFADVTKATPDKTETKKSYGLNLKLKPSGSGIGRGAWDSGGEGFDNAHLIGDQFGGAGRNESLNIYRSTEKYNRDTMLSVEQELAKYIRENNISTFDMEVVAKIKKEGEVGSGVNALINNEIEKDIKTGKDLSTKEEVKFEKELENPNFIKQIREAFKDDFEHLPGKFLETSYDVKQTGGKSVTKNKISEDTDYDTIITKLKTKPKK
jgi:DNA/RNA non-specific endonuclease